MVQPRRPDRTTARSAIDDEGPLPWTELLFVAGQRDRFRSGIVAADYGMESIEQVQEHRGVEGRSSVEEDTKRPELRRQRHSSTIQTYQHLPPGMGADAAARFERLAGPVPTDDANSAERRGNNRRNTA